MPVHYDDKFARFTLETANTCYVMQILFDKYPVHLYYGKKDCHGGISYQNPYKSFSPYFDEHGLSYSPDIGMAEYSYFGSGDFRITPLRIKNKNGDSVTHFTYDGYRIFDGRMNLPRLPYSEADSDTQTLELSLLDSVSGCSLKLFYTVFPNEDVISRYALVENESGAPVTVEKIMSLMLDLPTSDFDMISLYGAHNAERSFQRVPLFHGVQSVMSRRGASSHQYNPFTALCAKNATERDGDVYGFNFVYSGNFLSETEVDQTGFTRVSLGLSSENFNWLLEDGDSFITPEAVMTYSKNGLGGMSRNFHRFVRAHILPPEPFEKRPVVLNTWEACYFDIDEKEMLRFAKSAADTGIDMLVMDDGWFGARNNDKAGLGDWYVNKNKFRDGLKSFVDRVKAYGIKFGIWIEPEMVNPDSDLYRAHPEWCIRCTDRNSTLSRNQLVLDMSNRDVVEYLKKSFSDSFDGISIDYFKWDMNRHMSEVGSPALPPERQGETAYRYMLGVYDLYRWFTKHFPGAMIENCSGGGGRYDLGMMKYSTQIWTSDNTWPKKRMKIQYSSTLAYPTCTMSCHVSNPKNICKNPDELKYRWHVALNGPLGYEMHLPNADDLIKATVKAQVEAYRSYEHLILRGDFYRIFSPFDSNYYAYYFTDAQHTEFLLSFEQSYGESAARVYLKIPEADENARYFDTVSGDIFDGRTLVNGIEVKTRETDPYSVMWHFVKTK